MLSKTFRLRHEKDINHVFKKGRGVYDNACGVKVVKNNLPYSRFGIVVGTKVDKAAVGRNRVKRQYREILRLMQNEVAQGFDVLLLTSKPAAELSYQEKEIRLRHVFKKAGLLS